ncbi:biotin/lipoyl-containing protein, partial [Aeromicrobium sp.]|uniref:biotin/lipoyl-containing protein n=1 Tax=Aeromicrobium sp. TaxID=1871063 RepID=UPI001986FECA
MATSVTLPALGESVTEGTVTQWLKQVGDTVAVDEPLLEISTDKVDTEIPSPVAGTLLEIKAAEDETVEIGAVLAVIGEAGETTDESAVAPVSDENLQEEKTGDAAAAPETATAAPDAPAENAPAKEPIAEEAAQERAPAAAGSAEAEQAAAENAPAPQAATAPSAGGTAV